MQQNLSDSAASSSPKDRSLEAYKAWIMEIAQRLTTEKAELRLTEEEWIANWKEYWKERKQS